MMPLFAKTKRAVLIALAVLASCTRGGPPAPIFVLGEQPQAVHSAPAAPAKPPPPAPAKNEPPKIEAPMIEPAKVPPPAPSDVAKAGPQAHPDQIVVGKGETLYMIARRYDLPVRSILDANHLEPPFTLAAGTTLTLPQEHFHTVRAGDTLYSISRLYGVEVSTLASFNRLAAPFAIRVGETLSLPASVTPPERVAATPPVSAPAAKPEIAPVPPSASALPTNKPAPDQSKDVASFSPRPGPGRVFAWPLEGRVIASYGTAPSGTHNDGINIAARAGEPVRAADAGKVAYAGNELRGYGNLVLIKHAGGYMTAYAHNSKLLVKRGEVVKRGQEIAKAGATGTVNAPQLHFEIRQGTRALDPANYLPSLRASAG